MKSGEDRNRTAHENTGKTGVSDRSGAKCGALAAREAQLLDALRDPELAIVVDAWPALSAAAKAGILGMIRGGCVPPT